MKQILRAMIRAWLLAGWALVAEAQIVAEPGVVDLGRRTQNVVAEAKVVLVNAGKEAVTIYDVQADCSCTAGTPGKQSLEPGEKAEMVIRSETRSYQGEITRRVVLRTSAGDVVVPVKVNVTAYERWEVKPPFITLAPSVRGEDASGSVMLEYLGEGTVTVGKITSDQSWMGGVVAQVDGGKPGQFVVMVRKQPEAPAGHHMVKMTAVTTDAVNPQVSFNVFMSVTSAVQVKPVPLVMPVAKVGKETRLKAELLGWDGDVPPRLELSRGTATVLGAGAEGVAFEVAITPEKAGALTQLLRIYRGEELELEVAVILRAE
jgi:hypothetical protein